jgi:arylsulfatase
MYEGGISVPSIMRVPGATRQGEFVRAPAHVTDIAPTILALAQIEQPKGEYRGRQVIPMQGNSMVDVLTGRSDQVHETFRQGWELNGRRAMRLGDWKIVYANAPWGKDRWELFNLAEDRAELNDLSETHPEKLKELIAEYEHYAKRNGVEDFEGLASRPGYSNSLNYYKDLDEVL